MSEIDDFTIEHLARWVDRALRPEEAETAMPAMLAVVHDDPTLVDLGWPRVAEIAGVW